MIRALAAALFCLVIAAPENGRAADAVPMERGLIIWIGCGRIVLEAADGYVFLRRYGGRHPSKGQTLVGDLHTLGMKELIVGSGDAGMEVGIEDTKLSRSSMMEMINDRCGYPGDVDAPPSEKP